MEKRHVRLCVENEFKKQNYTPIDKEKALQYSFFVNTPTFITIMNFYVREVVDELNYDPENVGLYSNTGCKRVAQKVSAFIIKEKYVRKQEL